MMNIKYESPNCWVLELKTETTLLTSSNNIDDLEDGGKLW